MPVMKTIVLFILTAIAEIIGCYLPYLWLRRDKSFWILIPAGLSLAVFVWLLSLHQTAAGRTYAAYGGVYVLVSLAWLRIIEGQQPDHWDIIGVATALVGMAIIAFAPRQTLM